jgi:hypothetical protein
MAKRYKDDWRPHTIALGDTERTTAWGLWLTGPHQALRLSDMYPSKSEALSAAREAVGKGWADHAVVRGLHLGPCTVVE